LKASQEAKSRQAIEAEIRAKVEAEEEVKWVNENSAREYIAVTLAMARVEAKAQAKLNSRIVIEAADDSDQDG